jgi:large subunit ribosomal protein L31
MIDVSTPDVYNLDLIMKKALHPKNYRPVVFKDLNNDVMFLTQSTVASDTTIKWEDGNEYPLITVHISSASHPFFTGQEKMIDIEGRVDRFKARQDAAAKRKEAAIAKANKIRVRKNADTVDAQ